MKRSLVPTLRAAKLLVSRRHAFFTKNCVSPAGRVCVYSSLILSAFFLLFFSSSIAVFFIFKAVLDCCVRCSNEVDIHRSLIGVSRGIGRPDRDILGFSEYKIPYARCWDQFVRYQIVCDLPHRAERDPKTSLPTVRLPTWLDKWSLASQDARSRRPCPLPRRPSPKRTPSSSWEGLKYSIFNRDSRTRAFSDRLISCWNSCRAASRHCFNRRWLQSKPGTSHIEVASHPSQQKIRRNSKFQWWKIYFEENFKKYVSRSDRSTYVIQTLQDGSDVHARHGTTGDDAIADTQSNTHSRFVCTDTKLVDVVIFFPLISNVLWRAISPDGWGVITWDKFWVWG